MWGYWENVSFFILGLFIFPKKEKKEQEKSMIDPFELPLLYENMSIMYEN